MDFENIFDKLLTDITHDYSFKVKTKEEDNNNEDNSLLPIFQSKINSSTYNNLINKVSQSLTVNDDNVNYLYVYFYYIYYSNYHLL